jgi:hypothetical protein
MGQVGADEAEEKEDEAAMVVAKRDREGTGYTGCVLEVQIDR